MSTTARSRLTDDRPTFEASHYPHVWPHREPGNASVVSDQDGALEGENVCPICGGGFEYVGPAIIRDEGNRDIQNSRDLEVTAYSGFERLATNRLREHDPTLPVYCLSCASDLGGDLENAVSYFEHVEKVNRSLARKLPTTTKAVPSLEAFAGADAHAAEAASTVMDWLAGPTRNLYLHGDVGVGKTTLAALAAVAVAQDGRTVEWLNVKRALTAMKTSFGNPDVDAPTWRLGADLLVLDDLGAERLTEWSRDVVGGWIYDRYDRGQPMIVTCNFKPSALIERTAAGEDIQIGKRLVSRLVGEGAVVLEVKGRDRRL
jgi:DNA replication protein DnaC